MINYRFKITSNLNNGILGTGEFKSSKELSNDEQIRFLNEYTNGTYLKQIGYIKIEINEI